MLDLRQMHSSVNQCCFTAACKMDTVRARHNLVSNSLEPGFLMCWPEHCQFLQRSAKGQCKLFSITTSVRDDE